MFVYLTVLGLLLPGLFSSWVSGGYSLVAMLRFSLQWHLLFLSMGSGCKGFSRRSLRAQ